jgi:hypothetical protein
MARFIRVEDIPESLWDKERSILYLPAQLVSSWEMLLEKYNLRERALLPTPKGLTGGMGQEDTDNFFCMAISKVISKRNDDHARSSKRADWYIRYIC